MTERKYRLYGFTKTLSFPCVCYGTRGYFFTIRWVRKYKCFKVYKGHTTADDVLHNFINNHGKAFFGIVVAYTVETSDDETE